jgi:hypothetical protein
MPGITDDQDFRDSVLPGGNHLENSISFGANGKAIRRILNIAARVNVSARS